MDVHPGYVLTKYFHPSLHLALEVYFNCVLKSLHNKSQHFDINSLQTWNFLYNINRVNIVFEQFYTKLFKTINSYAPVVSAPKYPS